MKRKHMFWLLAAPAAVSVGGALVWRWLSSREERPCPAWLSILLENPYMNAVAGADSILDRLEIKPGMQLLDVGCGPGRLAIPAAQRVGPDGQVTALDVQPEMLRRAEEKAAANNLGNIRFLKAGIGAGSLPVEQFDRALLVTVLGEVHDREAALAEIFAALKPGGILSISEALPDPHYQRKNSVEQLALSTGFEIGQFLAKWPGLYGAF